MAFDYVVSLNLEGRRCVVAGDGPLAAERVADLRRSGALVTVVTPSPQAGVLPDGVAHVARLARPADLDGAFLAIVTREDSADVASLWAAAEERGVLFAALDDVAHCHFGAVSSIQHGPVTMTISTAGRAPALSKRLRRHLEAQLGPELGVLANTLYEARAQVLPRTALFGEWASRWEEALADLDLLLAWARDGKRDRIVEHVLAHVEEAGTRRRTVSA